MRPMLKKMVREALNVVRENEREGGTYVLYPGKPLQFCPRQRVNLRKPTVTLPVGTLPESVDDILASIRKRVAAQNGRTFAEQRAIERHTSALANSSSLAGTDTPEWRSILAKIENT